MADENPSGPSAGHSEHSPAESNLSAAASHAGAGAKQAMAEAGLENEGSSLATALLIGTGVAIIEPELIPGMLIDAGAWLARKLLPALGTMLKPVVKGVVKAGYSATMTVRQAVAEATEHVEDMVAEARSEYEAENGAPANGGGAAAPETPKRQRRAPRAPHPNPATAL